MKFCITGVSGTGKTTVSKELSKLGIQSFDIDEIRGLCHWRNKESNQKAHYYAGIGIDWLKAHDWICDIDLLKTELEKYAGTVVVIGMPANQNEFYALFDKIFLFQCNEETFLHRINSRTDNEFGQDPEENKWIVSWYKDFEKEVLDRGAIPINTDRSVKEITEEIVIKIKS